MMPPEIGLPEVPGSEESRLTTLHYISGHENHWFGICRIYSNLYHCPFFDGAKIWKRFDTSKPARNNFKENPPALFSLPLCAARASYNAKRPTVK